jgi:MarR-like DNA-binding transcriptional regulator SgrR of sgrS sRNA
MKQALAEGSSHEVDLVEAYEHGSCIMQNYLDDERREWISGRLDSALGEAAPETRSQIMRQIEEHLRDEAALIFLYHQQLQTYLHPSVQGAQLNTLGWIDFKDVWLENCLDSGGDVNEIGSIGIGI